MTITITVPEELEGQLQREAASQHRSVEEVALDMLSSVLEQKAGVLTLEEVVARIQAAPPNPQSLRPASGSLAVALRHAPEDPEFDLEEWQDAWTAVEAEMKAVTRANTIAEGRE